MIEDDFVHGLSDLLDDIESHDALGPDGLGFTTSVRRFVDAWRSVPTLSVATSLERLAEVTTALRRRGGARGVVSLVRPDDPLSWLAREICDVELTPDEVGDWLDARRRSWRGLTADQLEPGVVYIKTAWGAKGDTVDQAYAFRGEELPGPPRADRFSVGEEDPLTAGAIAYIPVTRPRFSFVNVCLAIPRYHDPRLPAWSYVGDVATAITRLGWG